MLDGNGRFIMEDYRSKAPFCSFLPGVSGREGIPLWCYYVNRGQAITSFGVMDKDHAMMEFHPAHTAYQMTERTGFRTFLRVDRRFMEPFASDAASRMVMGMNELELHEETEGLSVSVRYATLPGERIAALMRTLTLRNRGTATVQMELLDGMPAVVPYGVGIGSLKMMTQTTKAWMQVEDVETRIPYYRVRVSMDDSASVRRIEGGHFAACFGSCGERLPILVDPDSIFGWDTALTRPRRFEEKGLSALLSEKQSTQNKFPCAFAAASFTLKPGEERSFSMLVGQTDTKERLHALLSKIHGVDFFLRKYEEAISVTEDLCASIRCRTGDPLFDAYCRQTYLDNLLRGGAPAVFQEGEKKRTLYLYGRKHGDPERDYNDFRMQPTFCSQGNGNFRDVNQNRRCDVLFQPAIEENAVRLFYELIQSDGYNPLVVKPSVYRVEDPAAYADCVRAESREALFSVLAGDIVPGELLMQAREWHYPDGMHAEKLFARILCTASEEPQADFGEGYWSDHWTYNLDLIESYLAVYPERKEALLFEDRSLRWYETKALVLPRARRYVQTEQGLRQYHALDRERKAHTIHTWMREDFGSGSEARSTVMEKLLLLCTVKFATLDPFGMGVEMEGGKPGWYDALNGLPGLFGSSVAESCELARLLGFTEQALCEHEGDILLYVEMAAFFTEVDASLALCHTETGEQLAFWEVVNRAKERYRERTADGVSGERTSLSMNMLADRIASWRERVLLGIRKAVAYGEGIVPTYFTFDVLHSENTPDGVMPTGFVPSPLPPFLEGPVRLLKLPASMTEKRDLYRRVRSSLLFDQKLSMYKVNASLGDTSFEIGRAKAFTPGWLENESIWLHMEYKYLLELLKSRMYTEFAEDFHRAGIPFQNPVVYGRSILENSSFLASSANPDPATHGRGFVARLSGSTAEFLHIWQILFFGAQPFLFEEGVLTLHFEPFLPAYLMPQDGYIRAVFVGSVEVTYEAVGLSALTPGEYRIISYRLEDAQGMTRVIEGDTLYGGDVLAVREGNIAKLHITLTGK